MIKASDLLLAPVPKRLSSRSGVFSRTGTRFISLKSEHPRELMTAALKTGLCWDITAAPDVPAGSTGLTIRLDRQSGIPSQGYRLSISPKKMEIVASDAAGAFYGACTLSQILLQCEDGIPCLSISDWPDFPARGVMLDISRDRVPSMETLYHLVDLLSSWKINQLQLYTEHTFQYTRHPLVWEKASPMTGGEIMLLDAYCREHFVELVPNQNSFGHMERWLKHDKYRPMAEAPKGCMTSIGRLDGPFSLCPIDGRSIRFLDGLYEELLPHFSSPLFNVGCDETFDLGCGRSKEAVEEKGAGRVYLDFLLQIYELGKSRGRTVMFWGDIILHHPELLPELPKDMIALEWGYEYDHPFQERLEKFAASGSPFYVCPGTSTWNSLAGRTSNMIGNITSAARSGLEQGAIGLLNTDWGDCGHWQPLSVSYLGFLVGAMSSWNARHDPRPFLAHSLSLHAFGDRTGRAGRAFYDLGNVYTSFKKRASNCSIPWQVLFGQSAWWRDESHTRDIHLGEFEQMQRGLIGVEETMEGSRIACVDGEIVREEMDHLLRLMELSAEVGMYRLGEQKPRDLEQRIEEAKMDQELVWLMRSRIGGLADSLARLDVPELKK